MQERIKSPPPPWFAYLIVLFGLVQLGVHFLALSPWWSGVLIWVIGLFSLFRLTSFVRTQCMVIYGLALSLMIIFQYAGGEFKAEKWLLHNLDLLLLFTSLSFLGLLNEHLALNQSQTSQEQQGLKGLLTSLFCLNVFGAVINLSILYLVGDQFKSKDPQGLSKTHQIVLSRAFVAALHWSPFMVSMAVILTYVQDIRMGLVVLFGAIYAFCAMLGTLWDLRGKATREFVGISFNWRSAQVPFILGSCALLGHFSFPGYPIIVWVALSAPMITFLMIKQWPWNASVQKHIREHVPSLSEPIAVFLGAGLLSAGIEGMLEQFDWSFEEYAQVGFMWYHSGLVVTLMGLSALLSINSLISVAVLAPLAQAFHPEPTLLGITLLMGWGVAALMNPVSAPNLLMTSRYKLRVGYLIRLNSVHALRQIGLSFIVAWVFCMFYRG